MNRQWQRRFPDGSQCRNKIRKERPVVFALPTFVFCVVSKTKPRLSGSSSDQDPQVGSIDSIRPMQRICSRGILQQADIALRELSTLGEKRVTRLPRGFCLVWPVGRPRHRKGMPPRQWAWQISEGQYAKTACCSRPRGFGAVKEKVGLTSQPCRGSAVSRDAGNRCTPV